MWDDLYNWIEQYGGCRYDLTDELYQLSNDAIFIDPDQWKINLNCLIDELDDMVDIIDEHKEDLPDIFPSYRAVRNYVIGETLTSLITIINDVKRKLNIEPVNINDIDTLSEHSLVLYELIDAVSTYSLEQLSKTDWFDEFEEDHDEFLLNEFGLHKNDITNIHFVVNDIIQAHEKDE